MRRHAALVGLGVILASAAARGDDASSFFRERVAPVLERRCVRCHDELSPKGGLSLSTAAGLRKEGDGGPAVVPGKPDESPLIDAVTGSPPEMPRKGDPLTPEQVADLRTWVDRGAAWPDGLSLRDRRFEGETWWAFAPLERPPAPVPRDRGWARTPVDAFVAARLDAQGLSPRPEADRRTLIRRLTYDLHGLPPTPGEVDSFLADSRPDAYERLADRLLASPRYGERMGRHWLDLVHYGDTHGYDKDKRRDHAWPYRDYVIRAFNADLPYPRFVRQQVAGDVLDPRDPDGPAAAGFIAAGPWDFVGHVELREGTVDKARARLIDRDDMLANVVSTFQSLTAHCARCHDHKFDPIPQKDYYRLQAVFAGVDRGDREVPGVEERRDRLTRRREYARTYLEIYEPAAEGLASEAVRRYGEQIGALYRELGQVRADQPTVPSPSNGYHSAVAPRREATKWVQVDLGRVVMIDRIRVFPSRPTDFPDTPGFGFPPAFRLETADDAGMTENHWAVDFPDGHLPPPGDGPVAWFPSRRARFVRFTATRLWKRTGDYVLALAELEVDSGGRNVAAGARVTALDSIEGGRWGAKYLVDGHDSRVKLPNPELVRGQLQEQIDTLNYRRRLVSEAAADLPAARAKVDALNAELRLIDAALAGLPEEPPLVYSVVPHAPRPVHVLNRGDVEQPGNPVGPGALSCVPGLDPVFTLPDPNDEGARRAALAGWLASPENVLTWRSMANRIWQTHFGRGIVDTPNDFGRNGSTPTHPELLDWLAAELRDNGGSVKALHRLVVTSAAYRQASGGDAASEAKDADNRWLWRQNRRRLDAESVRDAVLSVSGTLDGRMGGPGFDLFRFKDDHSPVYDHAAPGAADNPRVRRRTVYRFTVRSVPNPFLDCLDSADPNLNTPVRSTTITALQALALLNDPFILSQSRAFAARLSGGAGDTASRVDSAYRLALSRPPLPDERDALAAYARMHGLAAACRVLLNTSEFLFVD